MKKPTGKRKLETGNTNDALAKIYRYCAYQERSHYEVRKKLFEYGLRSSEVDEILARLITESFLNEERFAKTFAGGKFRMLKWGKLKIQRELEMLQLTQRCIAKGLAEIDSSEYKKTLSNLIAKKADQIDETNIFKLKSKLANYAIGKGYEPELVWEVIQNQIE
ncbi:MAG TPA: RecX family transcriptional regulator [Cytophagales bacterium]|jgi:regulatory protein|nr:RecX family transcriptional regulator [Cytophagales bacterium]